MKSLHHIGGNSLGDFLRSTREENDLSIEDVAQSTHIRSQLIAAIERNDFSAFGSEVYSLGIVKNYAKALGIPSQKIVALYKRQQQPLPERQQLQDVGGVHKEKSKSRWQIIFTPRLGGAAAGILLFLGFAIYALNQLSALFAPPSLQLTSPVGLTADYVGEILVAGNSFQLKGISSPTSIVTFNAEVLQTEADGTFSTNEIPLRDEELHIVITATSQMGRTSSINLTIRKGSTGIVTTEEMAILLEIRNETSSVLVRTDGKIVFDDSAFPGDFISLEAKRTLQIETPTPQNIILTINGINYIVEGINTLWELIDGQVIKQ